MAEEAWSAEELALFDEDCGYALEGLPSSLSRPVSYTRVSASVKSVTAGTAAESGATGTVTMLRLDFNAKQGQKGKQGPADETVGHAETGLVGYMVRKSHIAAQVSGFVEPSRLDHFTDAGETYMVRNYSGDGASRFWLLRCEKASLP